ncbi:MULTISPECIES: MarC family protein [unclassified Minwuia]|jgi:MarC family membrane protein|uniref:MarC family protein n=1 Tax=unclassified Minwuia TaxID=2618799 RepID=UPI0024796273|nr:MULTISPECIES: MarC family protein [unclassified Minwuia]
MTDAFVPALVTFFVIIDPIGLAPMFASLTEGTDAAHRRRMALRSVMISAMIITGFAYGGSFLLGALGITLEAFRAAGGLLLFLIALDMVFEKRTERREKRNDQILEHRDDSPTDISVFPLAIPLMAGPGAIATIMLYMKSAGDDVVAQLTVLGAAGINLLVCLVIFIAVGPLMRVLGETVAQTIGRILGVILAALAVQLIFDAISNTFGA